MSTTRCPVVRLQSGWAGEQGFTTDYHDWRDGSGCCAFCGVSRRLAAAGGTPRPGWRGLEVDRFERDLQQVLAEAREADPTFTPDSGRWTRIIDAVQGLL